MIDGHDLQQQRVRHAEPDQLPRRGHVGRIVEREEEQRGRQDGAEHEGVPAAPAAARAIGPRPDHGIDERVDEQAERERGADRAASRPRT